MASDMSGIQEISSDKEELLPEQLPEQPLPEPQPHVLEPHILQVHELQRMVRIVDEHTPPPMKEVAANAPHFDEHTPPPMEEIAENAPNYSGPNPEPEGRNSRPYHPQPEMNPGPSGHNNVHHQSNHPGQPSRLRRPATSSRWQRTIRLPFPLRFPYPDPFSGPVPFPYRMLDPRNLYDFPDPNAPEMPSSDSRTLRHEVLMNRYKAAMLKALRMEIDKPENVSHSCGGFFLSCRCCRRCPHPSFE